ncbi:MAG: agmatine deiminase family protein [Chloroflexaceae bacterium]|nr:agmatine deiminase family protein [Chloroflexaceae bacterium]
MSTPFSYRMPAEWEPHQATWLSWPHNPETWPGLLDRVLPAYARMVAVLARSEAVHINVNDAAMEAQARTLLRAAGAAGEIHFHHIPTNDAWCRDHGAIMVLVSPTPPALVAMDWEYNAWGGKYPPFDLDNQVPAQMATALGVERVVGGMVLEGGSIETNGAGVFLTTEPCLLNPNRNPHLSRASIEQQLGARLGAEVVIWLPQGIAGDDTDGHIDNLARFVAADTVVTAVEEDPSEVNYLPLQANLAGLRSSCDQHGNPFRIIELPMPPVLTWQGQRLPASYANFYLANRVVLVPFYRHPNDERVRQVFQELFPDREVVGIDATDLVAGLGAFHCLTQQIPALPKRD